MNRRNLSVLLVFATLAMQACIIRTSSGRPVNNGRGNSPNCAPAHHWDGNSCVHNGNGNGNGHGHGDDHGHGRGHD